MMEGGVRHQGCLANPNRICRQISIQSFSTRAVSRAPLLVRAKQGGGKWPFGGGGNQGGNDKDAARKAIEGAFNTPKHQFGKKKKDQPATPPPDTAKPKGSNPLQSLFSGGGGMFGGGKGDSGNRGGSGGGGFSNFGDQPGGPEDSHASEKTLLQEFLEMLRTIWVVGTNTALFLLVSSILHRSLDWCCSVELLSLVGAPQQAFERVASVFFNALEWVQKNLLGWAVPEEEDMIPMYKNLALYYPEEHAYTFDSYRYPHMSAEDKQALKHFYALRHYERDGGYAGDVTGEDVQRIHDKYEPLEADRRRYQEAARSGRLGEYWAQHKHVYEAVTGRSFPAAAAASTAGAQS